METRRPLRIGFIFEGPTDQETIPVLVAKLLNRPVERIPFNKEAPGFDDFRRRRQGDNPNLNRAWGMLKSYTIALLIQGADAVVIVVDNDREPLHKRWCLLGRNLPFEYPQRRIEWVDVSGQAAQCSNLYLTLDSLLDRILSTHQAGAVPIVIGVAVQMLEAWLLAQPEVVENVLWDSLSSQDRNRCVTPEAIPHPKNEIIHPHNGGDDLSQGQARQVGEYPGFSPEPIEAACPSFARFAADIRVLATIP